MGLFGYKRGYDRQTFKENNKKFEERIEALIQSIETRDRDIFSRDLIKALNWIALNFDQYRYNDKATVYEIIDSEIEKRLTAMEEDVENNRPASLIVRMLFLAEELYEGRSRGQNIFNLEEREAEIVIAESLQNYYDDCAHEKEIYKLQEEILEKASKSNEEERNLLRLEYNKLEHEKEPLKDDINFWKERQLSARELIKSKWVAKELEKFRVVDYCYYFWSDALRDFGKAIYSISCSIEVHLERGGSWPPPPPCHHPLPFDTSLYDKNGAFDKEMAEFDKIIAEKEANKPKSDVESPKSEDLFDLLMRSDYSNKENK